VACEWVIYELRGHKMKIILHADDYGFNKEVSEDILDCYKNGTLHGISIMPNSKYFDECMMMLQNEKLICDDGTVKDGNALLKTIHFSISEGPSVSDSKNLPLLCNENGMFKLSFFKLLLMSIGPKKKELERELRIELKAQYEKALPYLDEINIDSHVHYHMIPLVLRTLLNVVEESGREIGYLRIPAEPRAPFRKHKEFRSSYDSINFVKNIVLNFLTFCSRDVLKKYENKTAVFFGIIMSGHMDIDRVSALLPDFIKIAEERGMDLEVLAHPGHALTRESLLDPSNEEYSKAPLSENRLIEKKMFMEIHNYL